MSRFAHQFSVTTPDGAATFEAPSEPPKPKLNGQAKAITAAPPLPLDLKVPAVNADAATRSIISIAQQIFLNSDIAWRTDRTLQREMRRDPDVNAPLEQRVLAVALCDFEVTPENQYAEDPQACAEANTIERCIRNMRRGTLFRRNLLVGANWWGHGVNDVQYERLDEPIVGRYVDEREEAKGKSAKAVEAQAMYAPVSWLPVHPDSIAFRFDEGHRGEPVIKVNPSRLQELKNKSPDWAGKHLTYTENGPAIRLTPDQLMKLVINVTNIEGADYDVAWEGEMPYAGRGLRDFCWYWWWCKQQTIRAMMTYSERVAKGTLIGKYPLGNPQAETAMKEVMINCLTDAAIVVPTVPGEENTMGVEILEASGTAWQLFGSAIQYFASGLKLSIVGQELTMEAKSTGLGSGVADIQQDTFKRIMLYDAACLDDTMTHDMVKTIQAINFPGSQWRHEYHTIIDDEDVTAIMEAAKMFVDMGGKLPADPLREKIGIRKAEEGEEVLEGMGGLGMPLDPSQDPNLGDYADARTIAQFMRVQ